MSSHGDGGPAFPTGQNANPGNPTPILDNGMSLRDWFAGQATEEDIEAHLGGEVCVESGRKINKRSRESAKYHYSDAMLAARKEKP